MNIPTYNEYAPCPMCIGDRVTTQFCQAETARCRVTLRFSSQLLFAHFHRVCDRCHHEWLEAPASYDPSRDAPRCEICGTSEPTCAAAECGHVVCFACRLPNEPIEESCPHCFEVEETGVAVQAR